MKLVDTHAHLSDSTFADSIASVLVRASQAGVSQIINVATTANSTLATIDLASQVEGVFATAGIHPNHAHQATDLDWETVVQSADSEKVVAIGETGLDRYWDDCPWPIQLANFERHIELSVSRKLPLIIHTRDCWDDMLAVLRRSASQYTLQGVMHSFTGNTEQADAFMSFGLDISFAGMLTYKKSEELRITASTVPLDRVLVETDSPYLSPEPHRGKRPNEPGRVVHTASVLAKCKQISLQEIATATTANARRLFRRITDSCLGPPSQSS